MHCRTCAGPVVEKAEICVQCGVRPQAGKKFCQGCGGETPNLGQEVCLHCGVRLGRSPGEASGDSAFAKGDLFYRLAGLAMVLSGAWNAIISFILFFSMIIVCVGVFWIIPGILALVYMGCGVALGMSGNKFRLAAFLPILGFGISLMNFNLISLILDLTALTLGIIGFVQNREEDPA